MDATMNAMHGGTIKARAADLGLGEKHEFTLLSFTDASGSVLNLHLPLKMSACASMIAGAFNAHLSAEPGVSVRVQVAAEATTDNGRYIGLRVNDADPGDKVAQAVAEGAPAE